jgi:hypothetical protein
MISLPNFIIEEYAESLTYGRKANVCLGKFLDEYELIVTQLAFLRFRCRLQVRLQLIKKHYTQSLRNIPRQ